MWFVANVSLRRTDVIYSELRLLVASQAEQFLHIKSRVSSSYFLSLLLLSPIFKLKPSIFPIFQLVKPKLIVEYKLLQLYVFWSEIFHNEASSMLTAVDVLSMTPRGYSQEFLVGLCLPVLQILTRFQTRKCNFQHPRVFRPGLAEIMLSLLRKKLFKSISNSHISLSF